MMPLFLTCLTYVQGLDSKNIVYALYLKEFRKNPHGF